MQPSSWRGRLLSGFFGLVSMGIYALWLMNLANNPWPEGVFAYQLTGNIPIFHLTAEFLMATVTLIGVLGLWTNRRWGGSLFLFGVGMFTYSAINSFGWALYNDIAQGIPMILTVIAAGGVALHTLQKQKK